MPIPIFEEKLRNSFRVASAIHTVVKLDKVQRRMIRLLDGSRSQAEIAEELARWDGGGPVEEIRPALPENLQRFAAWALLEG